MRIKPSLMPLDILLVSQTLSSSPKDICYSNHTHLKFTHGWDFERFSF